MRTFCLACFLVFACFVAASHVSAEAIGAWSEAVNGVQGRLIAKEDRIFNGIKIVAVYLELRNTTNVLGSIDVYFDIDKLTSQIVDSADAPISKPTEAPMSVFALQPLWLVLPFDGSLRFRVLSPGMASRNKVEPQSR